MANVSYEDYKKQQAARQAAGNNQGERKPVHFMSEFLANDGDQVVVRFPYTSPSDIMFESVHNVVGVFPGDRYGKSVRCTGDDNCPLCKSEDEAVRKRKLKFYAKFVVYNPTADGAELCATVWERPSGFADIDLKGLMVEYGDLTNYLFKITKSGKGTDTRYNIIPVNMQSPVYSKPVYSVKDFSCLEGVDATKILSKSIEQYNAIVNPEAVKQEETAQTQTQYANPQYTAPTKEFVPQPDEVPMAEVKPLPQSNPTPQPTQTTTNSGVTRYKF